jgi:hypothetical protein
MTKPPEELVLRKPGIVDVGRPRFLHQVRASLCHSKDYIALERLLGCRNFHRASGSARGHRGFDFVTGNDREGRCRAIKADIGRARQIVSQNSDDPPHLAGGRVGFDKWTEPHRQPEDVATAPTDYATCEIGTTFAGKPVESPLVD